MMMERICFAFLDLPKIADQNSSVRTEQRLIRSEQNCLYFRCSLEPLYTFPPSCSAWIC